MGRAVERVQRHRLQVWDAAVCAASLQVGATHLLSKVIQDGAMLDGVPIVDPFEAANAGVVDRLLPAYR